MRNSSEGGSRLGGSRSSHGTGHESVESVVEISCKQVVKDIIKELNENVAVIYARLFGLGKDWELMQKSMEGMCVDVLRVQQKIDNIEIKVETMTMGVLNKVFGVGDSMTINADNVKDVVVARVLAEEENDAESCG